MNIMLYLHSGSLNRGCEALARSATQIVHQSLPESKIFVSSFLPQSDKHLQGVEAVYDMNAKPIEKGSFDYFRAAIGLKLFGDESLSIRKSNEEFLNRIPKNEAFLSIGGDAYCYGEQPIWYELNRNIKKQGKKLVLWGCSIGEEDITPAKLEDLKGYDLILARESITYEMLKSKGLDNVRLVADGAFLMAKEELPLPDGWVEGNTVGLNFSPLVYKKNPDARKAFGDLIQHILDTTDMTICLTPHVTEPGNNDFEMLSDFYKHFRETGRVIILPDNLNAVQYKGYIARMRFFVGARTHATIAAYSNAVPTMVLGYSVKSKGIAKDLFGSEKLVLGIDEISDSEKLKKNFDAMVSDESNIRKSLTDVLPHIKKMSAKAGEYLSELLG
ncbi:MAG: polysaccharide pyruvyl transferase family protein [Flavobacterium sp.]|nr:MAG: polysaccharide pyruvyl transferase family protein [Flavobacterium sp.]